jgi:hypothetical protein
MKLRNVLSVALTTIAVLSLPSIVFASANPGCDPADPLCPIDGGVSLLIAAGIGIGARKAYQERNKAKGLSTNND